MIIVQATTTTGNISRLVIVKTASSVASSLTVAGPTSNVSQDACSCFDRGQLSLYHCKGICNLRPGTGMNQWAPFGIAMKMSSLYMEVGY